MDPDRRQVDYWILFICCFQELVANTKALTLLCVMDNDIATMSSTIFSPVYEFIWTQLCVGQISWLHLMKAKLPNLTIYHFCVIHERTIP